MENIYLEEESEKHLHSDIKKISEEILKNKVYNSDCKIERFLIFNIPQYSDNDNDIQNILVHSIHLPAVLSVIIINYTSKPIRIEYVLYNFVSLKEYGLNFFSDIFINDKKLLFNLFLIIKQNTLLEHCLIDNKCIPYVNDNTIIERNIQTRFNYISLFNDYMKVTKYINKYIECNVYDPAIIIKQMNRKYEICSNYNKFLLNIIDKQLFEYVLQITKIIIDIFNTYKNGCNK
jgi:hypothetical protein